MMRVEVKNVEVSCEGVDTVEMFITNLAVPGGG